jgi:pimeloyl-ACP methyl ester carboxylesterase
MPADPQGCLAALARSADLRFYGTDDFVQDLDHVRGVLGHDGLDIFGISYGTRAAWWYARRFPERLRSVVLLSPNPPSQRLFESVGQDTRAVLDAIVAHCQADAACARAFPGLVAQMEPALQAVAGARLVGLPLLLYSPETARRLPWLIAQARPPRAAALENALDDALRDGQSQVALGLLLTVQCSEELAVNQRVAEWPVSAWTWDLFAAACREWPRVNVPTRFRDRFSSSARALIISGEWDPTTGPRWAREMGTYFGRSTVLTISKGTHGLSDVAGCLSDVMAAFLDERAASTACLTELESRRYFVPGRRN